MTPDERKLRMLLAFAVSGGHLYTDDGELSDSSVVPQIDYLRDPVDVIETKIKERNLKRLTGQYAGDIVSIDYTNWRGERAFRDIRPKHIHYGSTQWHKEEQWFLSAEDVRDGNKVKDFAVKDIHIWTGRIDCLVGVRYVVRRRIVQRK
jgi:hypothetical protein